MIEVKTERRGDIIVVKISGSLDTGAAAVFDRELRPQLEGEAVRVVINLGGVSYLCSAGMRVMIAATKKLKGAGGRCAFCALQEPVAEIVRLAGFDRVLELYPTEAAAASALGG